MTTDFSELEKLGISKPLAEEILRSGVEAILVRDDLIPAATYFNFGKIIFLRSFNSYELKTGAAEISSREGIDLLPGELYTWLLYHEWAHHKGLDEKAANIFASKVLAIRRGFYRKIKVTINTDRARSIYDPPF